MKKIMLDSPETAAIYAEYILVNNTTYYIYIYIYVLAKKIYEKQFIFMEIAMKQNNNENLNNLPRICQENRIIMLKKKISLFFQKLNCSHIVTLHQQNIFSREKAQNQNESSF